MYRKNKLEYDRASRRSSAVRSNVVALFFLTACSRNAASSVDASAVVPIVATNVVVHFDASVVDAGVARADCAEPTKLTQLGTVNDVGTFSHETLIGQTHSYDPETLKPSALPPTPPPEKPSTANTPSRYASIVNGVGLISSGEDSDARVEDAATHKLILNVDMCMAGGSWTYTLSSTGRFLICHSNRAGDFLWDLHAAHPDSSKMVTWGANDRVADEGLFVSPNDSYAVAVPVLSWGNNEPTRPSITYFDLDSHKSKSLGKAPDPENDVGSEGEDAHPYVVRFCGDGELFATSGFKELTVYRGKDGARLAGAPALKGGYISFSDSGKYLSQTRNGKTTIFRLDP